MLIQEMFVKETIIEDKYQILSKMGTWFFNRETAEFILKYYDLVPTHYISEAKIGWRIKPKTEQMKAMWSLAKGK